MIITSYVADNWYFWSSTATDLNAQLSINIPSLIVHGVAKLLSAMTKKSRQASHIW